MQKLVKFLIFENYCYTENEALKIIESASDEFYFSLIEAAEADAVAEIRKQLKQLMGSMIAETNPKKKTTLANQYKKLQQKLQSTSKEEKTMRSIRQLAGSDNPANRPTPNRGRTQTTDIGVTRTAAARERETGRPMTGAKINDPRVAASSERFTSRATGTSAEVRRAGGASSQSTGVVRTGKYSNMQRGTGSTSALPNRGTSSTSERFPRQRG